MKAILIIMGIIAFIIAFFYIPVNIDVVLGENNIINLRYLFFKKLLYPFSETEENETEEKPKKVKKKKQDNEEKSTTSSMDFYEILDLLKKSLSNIKAYFKALLRAIEIKNLYLNWQIGGDDAAEIAINYGKCNGLFYSVYAICACMLKIKPQKIIINANFQLEKSTVDFKTTVKIIPARLIGSTFTFGFKMLILYLKDINNKNNKKVVKKNESRTSN